MKTVWTFVKGMMVGFIFGAVWFVIETLSSSDLRKYLNKAAKKL